MWNGTATACTSHPPTPSSALPLTKTAAAGTSEAPGPLPALLPFGFWGGTVGPLGKGVPNSGLLPTTWPPPAGTEPQGHPPAPYLPRYWPPALQSSQGVFFTIVTVSARRDVTACSGALAFLQVTPSSHSTVQEVAFHLQPMSRNKSSHLYNQSSTEVIIVIKLPLFQQNVPYVAHFFQLCYNVFL